MVWPKPWHFGALLSIVMSETASFYEDTTAFSLNTAVGGEVFLTQRRRDAENAEKIENLGFYRSGLNNLLFHPLGDVLLQRNLMHSSSYSQNSRQSLRSQPLCGSA